jgi:hypothetical protein
MASPPIFVKADEPLLVFESLERAVSYLEWQDVEAGVYRGYDSSGRRVEFGTEPIARTWRQPFRDKRVVARVETDPRHVDELRLTLARILAIPEVTPLKDLEAAAVERFGFA